MADDDKKKKKKGVTANIGGVKVKVSAKKAGKAKGAKKASKARKADHSALETLAKLAESPIVADIIAVGATAAVAALASKAAGTKDGNAVKNAGKAAAAAIGRRLMEEYDAVKSSAKDAPKKA